jgi:hypothetical protein
MATDETPPSDFFGYLNYYIKSFAMAVFTIVYVILCAIAIFYYTKCNEEIVWWEMILSVFFSPFYVPYKYFTAFRVTGTCY